MSTLTPGLGDRLDRAEPNCAVADLALLCEADGNPLRHRYGNMERPGLPVAYTREIWMSPGPLASLPDWWERPFYQQ